MAFTLSIIFNKEKNHVLMLRDKRENRLNFIGGKIEELEQDMDASYRELTEKTELTKDDVQLEFVRREHVSNALKDCWSLYVTAGVLKSDKVLRRVGEPLIWVPVNDFNTLLFDTYGRGNCLVFLNEAKLVCGIE